MKFLISFLLAMAAVLPSKAEIIPGTHIDLDPPTGFSPSNRFSGFQNTQTNSVIMVLEYPSGYDEIVSLMINDPSKLERNAVLVSNETVVVDGRRAELIELRQQMVGIDTAFTNISLIIPNSDGEGISVIRAMIPTSNRDGYIDEIKRALLSLRVVQESSALDGLRYTVSPVAPFEIHSATGQTLLVTPGGKKPELDNILPLFVVGLSLGHGVDPKDWESWANERVKTSQLIKADTISVQGSIEIDGLQGLTVRANGVLKTTGEPADLLMIILFEPEGYVLMQGYSKVTNPYEEQFLRMAKSFRHK